MSNKFEKWMRGIDRRLTQLERSRIRAQRGSVQDTGWVSMPLLNGWSSTLGLKYRKIGSLVEVRGRVLPGTDQEIAVLPTGARPNALEIFTLDMQYSTEVARVVVETNGRIWFAGNDPPQVLISFAGVLFFTD